MAAVDAFCDASGKGWKHKDKQVANSKEGATSAQFPAGAWLLSLLTPQHDTDPLVVVRN